jgi:hypothetical protein
VWTQRASKGARVGAKGKAVTKREKALRDLEEQKAAEREKTARLRALREERDRRLGMIVKQAMSRKPGQKSDKPKPLSAWLDEQEKYGRGR